MDNPHRAASRCSFAAIRALLAAPAFAAGLLLVVPGRPVSGADNGARAWWRYGTGALGGDAIQLVAPVDGQRLPAAAVPSAADDGQTVTGGGQAADPPALLRPFVITADGGVAASAPPAAVPPVARSPRQQLSSLLRPLHMAEPVHAAHESAGIDPGVSSRCRRPRDDDPVVEELPTLLRPFYTTMDGHPLEGASESPLVVSAWWARAAWRAGPFTRGSVLWQPLLWPDEPNVTAVLDDTSLVAHELDEYEPLPSPGTRDDVQNQGEAESLAPPSGKESAPSKKFAEAEKLGSPPEDNTLDFLRMATVLLKPGQLQMDVGVTYALAESDLPLFLAPEAVIESRIRQRQLLVPLEFRYGVCRNAQVFVNIPLGWANAEWAVDGLDEFENTGGIGDVRGGVTMLLKQGSGASCDITFTFAFSVPTGAATILTAASPLAPANMGDGFWALSGDLLLINNYDPVVFYYGFGTRQRFENTYEGHLFAPGGEYVYLIGAGFAVNEHITLSSTFAGSYISELYIDNQRLAGSIREPMSVRLAATIARRSKLVEPFVEFGLTADATAARLGVVWTY